MRKTVTARLTPRRNEKLNVTTDMIESKLKAKNCKLYHVVVTLIFSFLRSVSLAVIVFVFLFFWLIRAVASSYVHQQHYRSRSIAFTFHLSLMSTSTVVQFKAMNLKRVMILVIRVALCSIFAFKLTSPRYLSISHLYAINISRYAIFLFRLPCHVTAVACSGFLLSRKGPWDFTVS